MTIEEFHTFNLPDNPGVYFFKKGEEILYIGKATSLRSRVRSYFDDDILKTRGLHIGNMVTIAENLEYKETKSVLEALLLENELIKKYKPKYNTREKDDKSYYVLIITDEDFPRVFMMRQRNLEKLQKEENEKLQSGEINKKDILKIKKTFGPYTSGFDAKQALKVIRKIFPFRDVCEPYKKSDPRKHKCFNFEIGLCPGVCQGAMSKTKYQNHIERLIEFLEGDGEALRRNLERDMTLASDAQEYEEAGRIKDIIFSLEHIRDAHLIKRDVNTSAQRIEAFDVAHLSGSDRVGVMTVVSGGIPAKHEYKKFKLTKDINDDLEGLKEILTRRFKHLDWGIPDLIVLDGDSRHIRVCIGVLTELEKEALENAEFIRVLKVCAVTKDRSHKAREIVMGPNFTKSDVDNFKKEIVLVNSEAHRFSIRYHRERRGKSLKTFNK